MKGMSHTMKILLADDHILFREALTTFMNAVRPQWNITPVSTFQHALDKIELKGADYYDIVLLDVRMVGMNGLEGLHHILNEFPSLKTAVISNIAREVQVRAAMQMGAATYLPKSLPGKSMVAAIHLAANGDKFVPIDENANTIMPSFYEIAMMEQDNITAKDGNEIFATKKDNGKY